MKINYRKYSMVQSVIGKVAREIGVSIGETNETFNDGIKKFGINWSAQGTKSADEAREYINKMYQALEVAEFLNTCNFEVDWFTDDFTITDDNREFWKSQMVELATAIKEHKLDRVWDFAMMN